MSEPNQPPASLIAALKGLLRPLVKFLIRRQITYPYLIQLLKGIYVDVAGEDFPIAGKKTTDSRISLLSGVHRKDIRRLRQEADPGLDTRTPSLAAQVVATWLAEPPYARDDGDPEPLYRLMTQGEPSFEALVEEVSRQDLRARSLLDEWLQKGLVTIDEEDRVHLQTEAFLPAEDFDDKAYFFGRSLAAHIAAGSENLDSDRPPHFDRLVYYNNLSPDSVKQLEKEARKASMQALKALNRKARQLQKQDSGKCRDPQTFHYGAFFHRKNQRDGNDES